MFGKLGAVILLVSDMERSADFYQNTLGLELKSKNRDWVEFFKSGTVLALHPSKFSDVGKEGVQVGFRVSNLDDVCKKLKGKNIKFVKEPTAEKFGKHAIIRDPDGYMISIMEMKLSEEEEMKAAPGYYGFTPV
jgi:catechol 2,3-dioxygenase-like lactoylglutathione lyase family enzyme